MHNVLNGHFPILVYGVIACCQRHGISKRRVHSQYTKGSLITGGGKRKKLLTSALTVFLRSCAYTCVSSYLIDGRQREVDGLPRQLLFVLYLGKLHCSCRRIRLNSVLSEKKKEQEKKANLMFEVINKEVNV